MPSIRARLAGHFIAYWFRASRYQPAEAALEEVYVKAESETVVDAPPAALAESPQYSLTLEMAELEGGQVWPVHHLVNREAKPEHGAGAGQVAIFWHGGAFIHKMTSHHWKLVHTLSSQTGVSFIIPHYTKAPYTTADQSILGGLALIIAVSNDPRYKDKEIVLMGDSAGGWFVYRLLLAMTELALGNFDQSVMFDLDAARVARRKMHKAITISACCDPDLGATAYVEDQKLQDDDPWLNQVNLRDIARLWLYGPAAMTPSSVERVPADCPAVTHAHLTPSPEDVPMTDARFTLLHGVGVLSEWAKREPDPKRPLRVMLSIGSADILYNQNIRMYKALAGLGENVVRPVLITEEGLFHDYPLFSFLPEAQRAVEQFVRLLRET